MVRSVEKVVELLQQYLNLNINVTSADVLRLNYEGNVFLRNGQVDLAIDCYNKALELGDKEQEGVLLLMRGSALLQRAYDYRIRYRDVLSLAEEVLPKIDTLMLLMMVLPLPVVSPAMSARDANFQVQVSLGVLLQIGTIYSSFEGATLTAWNEARQRWPDWTSASVTNGGQLLARGCFYWALYEQALLRSLQDLLSATVILPGFAQTWRRAGEALSEMRLLSSAVEYYQVAIHLDSSLTDVLRPAMERIKIMEKVTEKSSSRGLSAEAFLSMLDE
jgi:tetratricopeptide (TPR) repeat protein